MQDHEAEQEIRTALRPLAIIIVALCAGIIAFGAVLVVLDSSRLPIVPTDPNILLYVLAALAASSFVALAVVRMAFVRRLQQQWREQPLESDPTLDFVGQFFQITLISAAIVEGLAMFALVTFMLTHNWIAFGAAAACVPIIATMFPTADRLRRFAAMITGRSWS